MSYLFDDSGMLIRESLYTLLFSPMDDVSLDQNGLSTIANANDKKQNTHIEQVFSYKRFSSSACFHSFVQMLDVKVCPYCNRSFTTTVAKSKSKLKTRPELDHYLSKSAYPFFALSVLNLVPSCGTCNRLKSNKETKVLYPYTESVGNRYRFVTRPGDDNDVLFVTGKRTKFDLRFIPVGLKDDHAENSKAVFGIEQLYKEAHRDFVSDIYYQRYIFTDEMLDELVKQCEGLFKNREELKYLLYLRGLREEEWSERPLSKLVHDIDQEITELNSRKKEEKT